MRRFCFLFPVLVLAAGLAIHVRGLVVGVTGTWEAFVHLSMLAINGSVLYGWGRRRRWGYMALVALFALFGTLQLVLAVLHFADPTAHPYTLLNAATVLVCAGVVLAARRAGE